MLPFPYLSIHCSCASNRSPGKRPCCIWSRYPEVPLSSNKQPACELLENVIFLYFYYIITILISIFSFLTENSQSNTNFKAENKCGFMLIENYYRHIYLVIYATHILVTRESCFFFIPIKQSTCFSLFCDLVNFHSLLHVFNCEYMNLL